MGNNNTEVFCDPEDAYVLTEQLPPSETDATIMVKRAEAGYPIHTRPTGQWDDQGVDLNLGSRSELLRERQNIEQNLEKFATNEGIDPMELKKAPLQTIHSHLRKKYAAKKAALTPQDAGNQATAGAVKPPPGDSSSTQPATLQGQQKT